MRNDLKNGDILGSQLLGAKKKINERGNGLRCAGTNVARQATITEMKLFRATPVLSLSEFPSYIAGQAMA